MPRLSSVPSGVSSFSPGELPELDFPKIYELTRRLLAPGSDNETEDPKESLFRIQIGTQIIEPIRRAISQLGRSPTDAELETMVSIALQQELPS